MNQEISEPKIKKIEPPTTTRRGWLLFTGLACAATAFIMYDCCGKRTANQYGNSFRESTPEFYSPAPVCPECTPCPPFEPTKYKGKGRGKRLSLDYTPEATPEQVQETTPEAEPSSLEKAVGDATPAPLQATPQAVVAPLYFGTSKKGESRGKPGEEDPNRGCGPRCPLRTN